MTGIKAFARIELPADIGKNKLATLKCKVDTSAGGNVMPLRTFAKLFPKRFDKDGNPTGLSPSSTCLTAYNGSPIKQFGTTYHITLHENTTPIVHPPHKCPITLQPLVRDKLNEWEQEEIITPVEEPTDWVSSLAYSMKPNGKL